RFRLRPPGTPAYLDEEATLVGLASAELEQMIAARPWLLRRHHPRELALSVCADLVAAWRSGDLSFFTHAYLWRAVPNHLRGDRRNRPPPGRLAEPAEAGPGDLLQRLIEESGDGDVRGRVAEFRAGLGPEDGELFDAWVARAGEWGWQKR